MAIQDNCDLQQENPLSMHNAYVVDKFMIVHFLCIGVNSRFLFLMLFKDTFFQLLSGTLAPVSSDKQVLSRECISSVSDKIGKWFAQERRCNAYPFILFLRHPGTHSQPYTMETDPSAQFVYADQATPPALVSPGRVWHIPLQTFPVHVPF